MSLTQPIAFVAGVRRGGKGERRAREAREDRTREDRGRYLLPPALILTFLPLYACHVSYPAYF